MGKRGLFGNPGVIGFVDGGGERGLREAFRFGDSHFERLRVSRYL